MKIDINISELEKDYIITEDGQVYSKIKNRWLKPSQNNFGYIQYSLMINGIGKSFKCHRLVAYKYLGLPPDTLYSHYEVHHKDNNKGNNHYSNLQWVTHSENHLASYRDHGRVSYWKGKHKPSLGLETRMKMADAKMKRLEVKGLKNCVYNSIEDACTDLGIYRKAINRAMNNNKSYKGLFFKIIPYRKEETNPSIVLSNVLSI